jgi:hypothetical protein
MMNKLEFSCFVDLFVRIFKTREEYGFLVIVWSKRLEFYVKLMSKNSISGLTDDDRSPTEYTEFLTKGRIQAELYHSMTACQSNILN